MFTVIHNKAAQDLRYWSSEILLGIVQLHDTHFLLIYCKVIKDFFLSLFI